MGVHQTVLPPHVSKFERWHFFPYQTAFVSSNNADLRTKIFGKYALGTACSRSVNHLSNDKECVAVSSFLVSPSLALPFFFFSFFGVVVVVVGVGG